MPGVASFAQHPNKAGESLAPLVEYMKKTLKHDAWLIQDLNARSSNSQITADAASHTHTVSV